MNLNVQTYMLRPENWIPAADCLCLTKQSSCGNLFLQTEHAQLYSNYPFQDIIILVESDTLEHKYLL